MINREELVKIAKEKNLDLYQQEKEYLQYIFLSKIVDYKDFILKGGTCLRICYGYFRFSEDLDFNTSLSPKKVKEVVRKVLNSFMLLNISYEIIKEELFKKNYTTTIRFNGPLYSGRKDSTNTIGLDIGKRKIGRFNVVQVNEKYSDVPAFFVRCYFEEEILAEKIRTVIMRCYPRDLFDVWVLSQKVKLNKKLVLDKLKEANVNKINFCSKKEYYRDLNALLTIVPDYEIVIEKVRNLLKEIKVLK